MWFPLFIKTKSHFKSEFDLNYEKYGYKLDSEGNWYNDIMTYNDALTIAEDFNKKGLYEDNTPSSWFLFGLLSYGYSINELKNQKLQDLNLPVLLFQRLKMFRKYKAELLTAIQK